jgi:hypothetical protein
MYWGIAFNSAQVKTSAITSGEACGNAIVKQPANTFSWATADTRSPRADVFLVAPST